MAGGFIPDPDNAEGSMTLEDFAAALFALEQAKDFGDLKPLLVRLRGGGILLPAERALAADVIEGKWQHPARNGPIARPAAKNARDLLLALDVRERLLAGEKYKTAVHSTAAAHKLKPSTVYAAARQHKDLLPPSSK